MDDDPRTVTTRDLVTGDKLLIAYFPMPGMVTVNGYAVSRSPELEDRHRRLCFFDLLATSYSPSKQLSLAGFSFRFSPNAPVAGFLRIRGASLALRPVGGGSN